MVRLQSSQVGRQTNPTTMDRMRIVPRYERTQPGTTHRVMYLNDTSVNDKQSKTVNFCITHVPTNII